MEYTGSVDQNHISKEGILGTIVAHLFLLLLFWWLGMKLPFPPPQEQGFLVSFGNTDSGEGKEQPVPVSDAQAIEENLEANPAAQAAPETKEVTKEVSLPAAQKGEALETSNDSQAPKLKDNEKKKKEDDKDKSKKTAASAKNKANENDNNIDPNALFKPKKTNQASNSSSSQGEKTSKADQGSRQGTLNNSTNAHNIPSGTPGIGASLSGRVLLDIPKPFDNSREEGVVVIKIKVDKSGKVIDAVFQSSGSTTSSSILKNLAINSAKKATFNADPASPDVQSGTIKYTFRNQ